MTSSKNNALYWHKENQAVVCDLCPRRCVLRDGQRGFCFVRKNQDGVLVSDAYGRCCGLSIDPIEKKPLYHFYPGSNILSFGTAGCNMGCMFCQNWHLSKAKSLREMSYEVTPKEIAKLAKKHNCRSVAFTYNDPIIFIEYAIETAKECKKLGIKTVAVTAGYIEEKPRKDFFEFIDAVNVDLKAFSEDFYKKNCLASLKPVLDTLLYIKQKTDVWLEITNLLIPGENDSQEEIITLVDWIADNLGLDVPLHLSAFYPSYKFMDKPKTPSEILKRARKMALVKDLRYVYTGNITDKEGGNTYCPGCGNTIIDREYFQLARTSIKDSCCKSCGYEIAGQF